MAPDGPLVLMILDGWGIAPPGPGNAVSAADTLALDNLWATQPHTQLVCHGEQVGLPAGQMGNSEVGHLNLGAGRVVPQDLIRINEAIEAGSFYYNPVLKKVMAQTRERNGALHLLGLLSNGGVHSAPSHLRALLRLANREGLRQVLVHAFMDGRDTNPRDGLGFMEETEEFLNDSGLGRIATVGGRFWGMDRDKHWDRVEKHYRALVWSKGRLAQGGVEAVHQGYESGESDEFITPTVILGSDGLPVGPIRNDDGVIFFNFRADRAREMTTALALPRFTGFYRGPQLNLAGYATMTLYNDDFDLPVAFPPIYPELTLGEIVSQAGLRQLRIAETEKYAHVTYFFNGGREKPFPGEDRILIPSPKEVSTYDQKPEMSALAVSDRVVSELNRNEYDLIVVNFANGDMVGHTGIMIAAVHAIEVVDKCIRRISEAVGRKNGTLVITADHGNAEQMINDEGQPYTAHSTDSPVPFILVGRGPMALRTDGRLADVAPTILNLLNLDHPPEMAGRSLIAR